MFDPEDEALPGLLILRTEGRMNFASAPQAGEHMRALVWNVCRSGRHPFV